jgi:transcriptional regulator with XRE-family HTH domain
MQRIGERIRKHREGQSFQLSLLAERVGVTVSCLSQIEKGKAFPSIITLKKIADNLHTTVGALIGENETLTKNPVLRANEKKFVKVNDSGTELYLISHHDQNKQMETYFIRFNKESDSSDVMTKHPGQEFCHLLAGRIEFRLNDEKYILEGGDNIYFNSNTLHYLKNIADGVSEMLWMITPPNI